MNASVSTFSVLQQISASVHELNVDKIALSDSHRLGNERSLPETQERAALIRQRSSRHLVDGNRSSRWSWSGSFKRQHGVKQKPPEGSK